MKTTRAGGQPVLESKPSVTDLDYQVKYERAFQAAIYPPRRFTASATAAKPSGKDNGSSPAESLADAVTAEVGRMGP